MEKTLPPATDDKKQAVAKDRGGWLDFFINHWFVILIIASFIITLVSLIIRSLLPKTTIIGENSWNEITPGHSDYAQLVEKLGPPLETIETEDGFNLKYQSDFLAIPNQVVTDKQGTIEFIREYLKYDPNHLLSEYTDKYGQPDLVLNDHQSGHALKAYAFLRQGILIVAHIKDGSVEQKWYFTPTDSQTFLKSWGENLTDEESEPERGI